MEHKVQIRATSAPRRRAAPWSVGPQSEESPRVMVFSAGTVMQIVVIGLSYDDPGGGSEPARGEL